MCLEPCLGTVKHVHDLCVTAPGRYGRLGLAVANPCYCRAAVGIYCHIRAPLFLKQSQGMDKSQKLTYIICSALKR